jgi:hypothetical protein
MKILYKFASRSRPDNFFRALDNIYINSRNKNFNILASLDLDDGRMNNESVIAKMNNYDKLIYHFDHSKNKIDAINRDMNLNICPSFDVLINMSDDMLFVQDGYDDELKKDFAGDYDLFLHYNDGSQKDNVCTMSIMGVDYYNRFKYIYHPSYESLWCDCEATDVAKELGRYKYMGHDKILFRHLHPSFGLARYDEQYRKTEAHDVRSRDEMNYINRKDKKFPISW